MRRLACLSAVACVFALTTSASAADHGFVTIDSPSSVSLAASNPESAARAVVAAGAPWAQALSLAHAKTTTLSTNETLVRLAQTHLGVPVLQRGAVVRFDAYGKAVHATLQLEEDLPASVVPTVNSKTAATVAATFTGVRFGASDARLAIWPSPDGAMLVWVVYAPPAGVPYAPVAIVSAATGDLVVSWNAATSLDKSQVYPTNPVKSPQLIDVTLNAAMGSTTLGNALVESKNCIDKHHTTMVMGFPVHVCDLIQTAVADANGDFMIPPGADTDPEDTFSEVSMFYHANRAYTFFQGFEPKLDVNGGIPLPTVSNLRIPQGFNPIDPAKLGDPNLPLVPFQNAFFAPQNPLFSQVFGIQGGAMWFGQGPVKDYSYDGDVVYHEFTHSVVNVTLQLVGNPHMDKWGASYAPSAMNEGLADFYSCAITGDPDVGEYATQDIAPGTKAIRTLDNKDNCPNSIAGEAHADSTLFSGALWEARKAMSPTDQIAFDTSIYAAMNASATGDLGYGDFAKLAIDAVQASSLGKAGADALTAAFTAHGILPECTRVLEYMGKPLVGPNKDLAGYFWSPGTSTTGVKTQEGYTAGVIQVHMKLPAGTGQIQLKLSGRDAPQQGIGGPTGTPFAPNVLARFAADPIQFTYKPMKTQSDTSVGMLSKKGNTYTATIPVTANATEAYVMIGNTGQSDGLITDITLTAEAGMPTTATGAGGATSTGAGGSGGAANNSPPAQEIGGCGCSLPRSTAVGGEAALLALAGALAARRRRKAR